MHINNTYKWETKKKNTTWKSYDIYKLNSHNTWSLSYVDHEYFWCLFFSWGGTKDSWGGREEAEGMEEWEERGGGRGGRMAVKMNAPTCTRAYTRTHTHTHTHTLKGTHTHTLKGTDTDAHTDTHIQAYIHTQTCSNEQYLPYLQNISAAISFTTTITDVRGPSCHFTTEWLHKF